MMQHNHRSARGLLCAALGATLSLAVVGSDHALALDPLDREFDRDDVEPGQRLVTQPPESPMPPMNRGILGGATSNLQRRDQVYQQLERQQQQQLGRIQLRGTIEEHRAAAPKRQHELFHRRQDRLRDVAERALQQPRDRQMRQELKQLDRERALFHRLQVSPELREQYGREWEQRRAEIQQRFGPQADPRRDQVLQRLQQQHGDFHRDGGIPHDAFRAPVAEIPHSVMPMVKPRGDVSRSTTPIVERPPLRRRPDRGFERE